MMMKSDNNKKHSYLPASACERWWNCPGSAKAAAEMPTQPSKYTAEGTVAHDILNYALLVNFTRKQLDAHFLDTARTEDDFVIQVTEEMLDAVWLAVEEIRSRVDLKRMEVHLEETVDLKQINDILFATPDVVIHEPFKKLTVIDYKHGAGKRVSAWENKQLLYYALAWFLKSEVDVNEIEIIIIQPRISDEEKVKSFTLRAKEIKIFKEELAQRVKLAMDPKALRIAGTWCRSTFCPAFAVCEEAQGYAQALVAGDFSNPPSPAGMSLKQIKEVLDAADFLTGWLDKVKEFAKEKILHGESVPGYKLVQGWGHRKYVSEDSIISDFGHLGDVLYEKKLKTPAKLEKIVGKKELEPYVYKPETGLNLVPEDHKAEAVMGISAAEDFSK